MEFGILLHVCLRPPDSIPWRSPNLDSEGSRQATPSRIPIIIPSTTITLIVTDAPAMNLAVVDGGLVAETRRRSKCETSINARTMLVFDMVTKAIESQMTDMKRDVILTP
jgi:hypothetical protein